VSLRRRFLNLLLRSFEKPALRRARGAAELRRAFECKARLFFHPPRGSRFRKGSLHHGGREVPVLWVGGAQKGRTGRHSGPEHAGTGAQTWETEKPAPAGLILYFHGGAYVFGSPRTHRAMVARIVALSGLPACLPAYRLAPEHPFPAAFDDAVLAYRALLACGYPAGKIMLGGDSAGGGLALALLAGIRARGWPRPAGCFALSPLTDLTYSGNSFRENAESELLLPVSRAGEIREMYLRDTPADDPRASPLFADFTGAPPVFLAVSESEILLDDTRRLAVRLETQGVRVTVMSDGDLPHVWPIFHGYLPEADRTLKQLAGWIRTLSPTPAGN